jgi:hypothetical protein
MPILLLSEGAFLFYDFSVSLSEAEVEISLSHSYRLSYVLACLREESHNE